MPETWNKLREQFALASADFLGLMGQLDDAQAAEPGVCGAWSVREIVAHLAAWDWEAERRFREFHAGNAADRTYDEDAFNATAVEERGGQSWDETLDELRRANMTYGASLANVSAGDREADPRYAAWLSAGVAHYTEHAAQIRAWRAG